MLAVMPMEVSAEGGFFPEDWECSRDAILALDHSAGEFAYIGTVPGEPVYLGEEYFVWIITNDQSTLIVTNGSLSAHLVWGEFHQTTQLLERESSIRINIQRTEACRRDYWFLGTSQ